MILRVRLLFFTLLLTVCLGSITQPVPRLSKGDTVGFVSPAGPYRSDVAALRSRIDANFKSMELRTRWAPHTFAKDGYLAGTDAERAEDLNNFFKDPEIKAIVCVRGGYGCNRILDLVLLSFSW